MATSVSEWCISICRGDPDQVELHCPICEGKAEAKTEADISATIRYIPESSIWALKIKRVIFSLLYLVTQSSPGWVNLQSWVWKVS